MWVPADRGRFSSKRLGEAVIPVIGQWVTGLDDRKMRDWRGFHGANAPRAAGQGACCGWYHYRQEVTLRLLHLAFLTLLLPGYIGGCLFLYKGSDFGLAVGFVGLHGTIHGHIRSGPVTPVGTEGIENSAPLEGATLRFVNSDGEIAATGTSDADGNFELQIPPGVYTVRALGFDDQPFPLPPVEHTVTIVGGSDFELRLEYDSGIR